MELYLDSADINEIEAAFELGFLAGLTTTPTFMHRHGITDIDGTILKLARMVPVLQIEALGDTADAICAEAYRQLDMGLEKDKTVFKIPISLEGVKACKRLRNEGIMINIHLVYTIQQAYMALSAGASYVCPLVGRLQDQGQDALGLVRQCVEAVDRYGYDSKIMFSSVRHTEHIKNAINIGVHTITVPWRVMQQMPQNHFTAIGTREFEEHTRLMTLKVGDVIRPANPTIPHDAPILDALVQMTESGFGAVGVLDAQGVLMGMFTDGDLRRLLSNNGKEALNQPLDSLDFNPPITIEADELLYAASQIFKEKKIDTICVTKNGNQVGMLDIQDLVKVNL